MNGNSTLHVNGENKGRRIRRGFYCLVNYTHTNKWDNKIVQCVFVDKFEPSQKYKHNEEPNIVNPIANANTML